MTLLGLGPRALGVVAGLVLLLGLSGVIGSRLVVDGAPPAPASATPVSGVPVSRVPASGVPVSGAPASGVPASGAAAPAQSLESSARASTASGSAAPGAVAPRPAAVERLRVRVLAEYPHDPDAYTQGLLWHDGVLYESTGIYGRSSVRRVDLESGRVEQRLDLPAAYFGEGLARVGERLFLLSWRSETGWVLDLATFAEIGRFSYFGEGWGLCHDEGGDRRLIMSNGSDQLVFRDPQGFKDLGGVAVTLEGRPLGRLNELECVGGEVWANVYGEDWIVRIDPASGRVTAVADASGLLPPAERERAEVLNGIAYRPDHDSFLLTGKFWPRLFEVAFEAVPGA